jgi:CelD/BcsL family acetyltransferase involved in cellulose biosynthesis
MAARTGALRMGTLHLGERPVAAQFWIVWQGRACIYKLAHDKSVDEYSPGTILTMRMMESVLSHDKPKEVNFGRGDDPYKKLWLPRRRERWGLAAANPRTLRGLGHAIRQTAARIARPLRPGSPRPPI